MAENIAPWLDGLGESWDTASIAGHQEEPTNFLTKNNAQSLRQSDRASKGPLAALTSVENNSIRISPHARDASQSIDSAESVVHHGTVQIQQRSKSASPKKGTESLEWRKRLLHGQVGYGDQIDLFGPSGLENIFTRNDNVDEGSAKARPRLGWWQPNNKDATHHMPSSPPIFSRHSASSINRKVSIESAHESRLPQMQTNTVTFHPQSPDDTLRSNPFDLQSTDVFVADCASETNEIQSTHLDMKEPGWVDNRMEMTGYGHTELEQEDFSPVFISKHTDATGRIDYAALDSRTVKELGRASTNSTRDHADYDSSLIPGEITLNQSEQQDDANLTDPSIDGPDLSLSENLPTGTPPIAGLNDYVQTSRGGYSTNGSFKERPLSPSPTRDERLQAGPVSDSAPTTPTRIVESEKSREDGIVDTPVPRNASETPKTRSSGSPLKLFGPHDTFTNNRLLRRMSQLNPGDSFASHFTPPPPRALTKPRRTGDVRITSSGSFGNGDLDQHTFQADITVTSASDSEQMAAGRSAQSQRSKSQLYAKVPISANLNDLSTLKRKLSIRSRPSSRQSMHHSQNQNTKREDRLREAKRVSSKRMPISPFKDPFPKRRRTLDRSEVKKANIYQVSRSNSNATSSERCNSKRKDARNGGKQINDDEGTSFSRKMPRPRDHTPIQSRQDINTAELREIVEEFTADELSNLTAMVEQLDMTVASDKSQIFQHQAEVVANAVASFALRIQRPSSERKRSVTTQDYFNEAQMVMDMIRAKARPHSGLGNVEESEAEGEHLTNAVEQLSALQISRPPSREGQKSGWRTTMKPHVDSRLASHLRRFQDADDDHIFEEEASSNASDATLEYRDHDESPPHSQQRQVDTFRSNLSEATGTNRTLCTTVSRKSDNVGNLAPEVVAHLIGEQVGRMSFDKAQQKWIRVKKVRGPEKHAPAEFLEPPSHITSEDDPFREISDLPVDEQAELRRVSATSQPEDVIAQNLALAEHGQDDTSAGIDATVDNEREPAAAEEPALACSRPVTRDSNLMPSMHSSTFPSRSAFFSSVEQERVETRATSWADETTARVSSLNKTAQQPLVHATTEVAMSLQEEQVSVCPPQHAMLDDIVEQMLGSNELATGRDSSEKIHATDNTVEDDQPKLEMSAPRVRSMPSRLSAGARPGIREPSLRRRTLTGRFHAAEMEDQSELSLIATLPGDRVVSVCLSVAKPQQIRRDAISRIQEVVPSSPVNLNSTFLLSDLPDFTVCEEDQVRPSEEKLAARLASYAVEESNDRYAFAVRDLVKTLTDVQANELYWDEVTDLDLHDRNLVSLFGLDDFCTKIKVMDISNNSIAHLHGAPGTIRHLNAQHNQMTDLTAFNHLPNLQSLDISANKLESLDGMKDLIHLRNLTANDNKISIVHGMQQLDALLRLDLCRNKIEQLDITQSDLTSLQHIDLSGNNIQSIHGLERLKALRTLRLDDNDQLQELCLNGPLPHLERLSIRNCSLRSLDVSVFPRLRTLNADDNALCSIKGIEMLQHLESLSMRRQKLGADEHIALFEKDISARNLYLSGNRLLSLHLTTGLLNIQHLELSATGLSELPVDFGLRMPNLRSLNLNFNALTDLRPLLNIQKLTSLVACGNRLDRLRRSVAVLARMKHLVTADLRDNPLTHGFYAAASLSAPNVTALCETRSAPSSADVDDEDAACLELDRYLAPVRDPGQDAAHVSRLDESLRLRRRVYETMLVNSCPCLGHVDGMAFDRKAAAEKDQAFDRLLELGVIRKSTSAIEG